MRKKPVSLITMIMLLLGVVFGGIVSSAGSAAAFSPCSGYCNNVQNMYWTLNTGTTLGICDNCGSAGLYNWVIPVGYITSSSTPDVSAYYIGTGYCAKEFRSYGENVWTENPNGPKVGPVKVPVGDFPWIRVYSYPAQPNGVGCNY